MSRWYRAYEGTVTDAKLGEVALVANCSRSVAIAAWHCLLESAAATNEGGKFDATPRRIAVILGEPIPTIEAVLAEMEALGMVEGGSIAAWKRRQYESDSSTERSRKHREAKRNADATLQGRCATPPETETETYTEKKESKEAQAPDYAFAGEVVRLKPADFQRWQRSYAKLDLMAELQSRDDWLATQPEPERKNWFHSTSAWLRKRHTEAETKPKVPL